jgi:peptide/nickel transport system substrate-binding protein
MISRASRRAVATATAVALALALAGCANGSGAPSPVRVGWAGELPPLDPAASRSAGSFAYLSQIYPALLQIDGDAPEPVPQIAASAQWTADGVYTVELLPGLVFANGHDLTTSDVKFSIERQLALQSEDGAWRQLSGLESTIIVDETTIEFHLTTAVDVRFPFVLAGPAGLILDEEAFYADELTPDDEVIQAAPFAGPFTLDASRTDVFVLDPNADFGGATPGAATLEVRPGAGDALADQLIDGSIDVVTGTLGTAARATLADADTLEMERAASGRVRLLAFDFAHMPFGSRTEAPDAGKALAVRAAISELVDREALVEEIGSAIIWPSYGYVATGLPGATQPFLDLRGDGEGGPSLERAQAALVGAGIAEPVALTIHVDPDQVGTAATAEITALAAQLDDSALFSTTIVETDADGLGAALIAGDVQAVFTSVLPSIFESQAYLAPFRSGGVLAPGYGDGTVDGLLARRTTELDPAVRAATLAEAQVAIATQLPAIPISQGVRLVFARTGVFGVALQESQPLDLSRLRR